MLAPPNRLIVVSNRLPFVLKKQDEAWSLVPGSGGRAHRRPDRTAHRVSESAGYRFVPVRGWQVPFNSQRS